MTTVVIDREDPPVNDAQVPIDAVRTRTVDDVVVVFFEPNHDFSDQEIQRWLDALERPNIRKTLALSVGPVRSEARRRRMIIAALQRRAIRLVAVSDNRLNRGLIGIFAYLGVSIAAYSWPQLEAAARDVAAKPELVARIVQAARALRAESPAAIGLDPDQG